MPVEAGGQGPCSCGLAESPSRSLSAFGLLRPNHSFPFSVSTHFHCSCRRPSPQARGPGMQRFFLCAWALSWVPLLLPPHSELAPGVREQPTRRLERAVGRTDEGATISAAENPQLAMLKLFHSRNPLYFLSLLCPRSNKETVRRSGWRVIWILVLALALCHRQSPPPPMDFSSVNAESGHRVCWNAWTLNSKGV